MWNRWSDSVSSPTAGKNSWPDTHLDHRLPDEVNWKKNKLGWPSPERFWFEGELRDWLDNTIKNSPFLKQQAFFSINNLEKASLLYKLRLLNIAVWHDIFLANDDIRK